jgi:hypothetical protein
MTNIKSFQKALKFLDSDFLLTGYDEAQSYIVPSDRKNKYFSTKERLAKAAANINWFVRFRAVVAGVAPLIVCWVLNCVRS